MLGRKDYTPEEFDQGKAAVKAALAGFSKLSKVTAAFEAMYFNNMTIVLDRYYVHRVRLVTGNDGNPLNEVEMLTDSLMNNGGVLRGINAIKYIPEQSVTQLNIGDPIKLTAAGFERLSAAFFAELEKKFR